nr:MAG: hypothetical protein AM325_16045 [Candidatus Thorarchaeota archaeon SMTZ1-45]
MTHSGIDFKDGELDEVITIFKTLSDPSRVRILSTLSKQESLSVGEIADRLEMKISSVSHQLSTLKMLGFVKNQRDGQHVYYSLDDDCITDIMMRARDHVTGK